MNLSEIKPGDKVLVCHLLSSDSIGKVERVTKTQIIIGGTRYRIKDGYLVGESQYSRTCIRLLEPGDEDLVKRRVVLSRMARLIATSSDSSKIPSESIYQAAKLLGIKT